MYVWIYKIKTMNAPEKAELHLPSTLATIKELPGLYLLWRQWAGEQMRKKWTVMAHKHVSCPTSKCDLFHLLNEIYLNEIYLKNIRQGSTSITSTSISWSCRLTFRVFCLFVCYTLKCSQIHCWSEKCQWYVWWNITGTAQVNLIYYWSNQILFKHTVLAKGKMCTYIFSISPRTSLFLMRVA